MGKTSLFLFQKGILGDGDLDLELHGNLCQMLQDPTWTRMLLCGFRGCLKTSTMRAWAWWQGLYSLEPGPDGFPIPVEGFIPNWSAFWIEQKYDNAIDHHKMMQAKFRYGPQSALLQDMFSDRIDGVFDRWTTNKTLLVQTDANAEPFISVGSLDSKLEGGHKESILGDDLEGADADKSDVPNAESAKFIFDRSAHLLKERYKGRMLFSGTPHGPDPLVYKWKNIEGDGSIDNSKREKWKIWWIPAIKDDGTSQWEERYPTKDLLLEKSIAEKAGGDLRRGWDTQMMLFRSTIGAQQFDMERIVENLYTLERIPAGGKIRHLILYEKQYFNHNKLDRFGQPAIDVKPASIDLAACRMYIHADPAHKDKSERISDVIPSKWAIVVVAVAPDLHTFVVDSWIKRDANVDQFLEQWLYFYRFYAPRVHGCCTFDPVGAQTWIKSHLALMEKHKYDKMTSLPAPWRQKRFRLPRPSTMLIESHKHGAGKIEHIVHELQTPHNMGWLHLRADPNTGSVHPSQMELYREHELLGTTDEETFDGIDALSQGPEVWQAPMSKEAVEAKLLRMKIQKMMDTYEGNIYETPWRDTQKSVTGTRLN